MATRPRLSAHGVDHSEPPRQSAVLILLYPLDEQLVLVLTRRTEAVRDHKGQISFPGGAKEPDDASLQETAIRETEEELGISLTEARILGELTSLYIPASNYQIHPYVAYVAARPRFCPSLVEVAELLEVPLASLLDRSLRRTEKWLLHGKEVEVPFFLLQGHKVWGATAMVLSELAAMLEAAAAPASQESKG